MLTTCFLHQYKQASKSAGKFAAHGHHWGRQNVIDEVELLELACHSPRV